MKIAKILIVSILVFVIVTMFTASLGYDTDGADRYGFPLEFYVKANGYNSVTYTGTTTVDFKPLSLIADFFSSVLLGWLLITFFAALTKKKSGNN